jgi:hypothetical protein
LIFFNEVKQTKGRIMDKLIDLVIDQIAEDLQGSDLTALEEMLRFVPKKYLVGYLSELHLAAMQE